MTEWTDRDVELQYTLNQSSDAAVWDGVYVTLDKEPDLTPLGEDDHTDDDVAELFCNLRQRQK